MGARRFMFTRNRERELVPEGVKLGLHRPPVPRQPRRGIPRRAPHRAGADRAEALTLAAG